MKRILMTAIMVLSVAWTGPAVADPTPNVTAQGKGDRVNTELSLDGQEQRAKAPTGPTKPSDTVYTLRPTCGDGSTVSGDLLTYCAPEPCGNGDREYVQTKEDRNGEFQGFDVRCGLPDNSPQSLAIREFYSTKVTVPTPTIAPKTTTYANFPNIYWSDVKTYEQPTDITAANVRLKLIPVSYRWDFGDGETMTLEDAGKPYDPALTKTTYDAEENYDNIHRYRELGTFDVTLTVVFHGQYSVNGSAWTNIAGSLTATSPAHPITVREARAQLVVPPTD